MCADAGRILKGGGLILMMNCRLNQNLALAYNQPQWRPLHQGALGGNSGFGLFPAPLLSGCSGLHFAEPRLLA